MKRAGLCGGGNRTWNGRQSDPEEIVVFKIIYVGAVPYLYIGREGI